MKKILLVEDNVDLQKLMQEGLARYRTKFECLVAHDGTNALEQMRRNHIHLLVTDLSLPGMSGFDLLTTTNREFPHIPCVAMLSVSPSGKHSKIDRAESLNYLTKPIRPDFFAKGINTLLGQGERTGGTTKTWLKDFMRIVEIERKSCTLAVASAKKTQAGTIYFRKGRLIEALQGDRKGKDALAAILDWKQMDVSFRDDCPGNLDAGMQGSLESILLELPKKESKSPGPTARIREKSKIEEKELHSILADAAKVFDRIPKTSNRSGQTESTPSPASAPDKPKETTRTESPAPDSGRPAAPAKSKGSPSPGKNTPDPRERERENIARQDLSFDQLLERGFSTFRKKDFELSKLFWEMALEMDPRSPIARRNLKVVSEKLEKGDA